MSTRKAPRLKRLLRFSLTTAQLEPLAEFYDRAFGCTVMGRESIKARDAAALYGVRSDAQRLLLSLGAHCIELLQFGKLGEDYPHDTHASDLNFQHFAIVVADMKEAYTRLARLTGWMAISSGGPQQLSPGAGNVSAFKFRDPEGHPLELLAFPASGTPPAWKKVSPRETLFLGIDHSAISVADTRRSVAFYQGLGLTVSAQYVNHGAQQARLDGLLMRSVEVTALTCEEGVAHVELLCYRGAAHGRSSRVADNDVAATRLVFDAPGSGVKSSIGRSIADPDGHRLVLLPAAPA
jgi:catechol 2,3-dioxygenase-like lactoylglutathione lyase family enzyme